jgi:inner membrane protein YidH
MHEHKETSGNEQTQGDLSEQKPFGLFHHALISKKASDHLANERTFLAWVRTGIAVMAFGFVIERFGILLRELGLKVGQTTGGTLHYSKWLGITVTLLGRFLLIVALFNFLQVRAALDRERYRPGMLFPVVLTAIATLIGVLLAIYLTVTT